MSLRHIHVQEEVINLPLLLFSLCISHIKSKALGHSKFSPLGWSDGGITALILAGTYPENVSRLVVWGANAYITENDVKMYEGIQHTLHNWGQ